MTKNTLPAHTARSSVGVMGRRRSLMAVVAVAVTLGGCATSTEDGAGPPAGTADASAGTTATTTTVTAADDAVATTAVPRVVVTVGGQTLAFTDPSAVLVCDADRGEAEVVVQGDGAEIAVRVPAARHPEETVVEVVLPDGTEWRRAESGPEVLLTDGTLVLGTVLTQLGGSDVERLELTAVCR